MILTIRGHLFKCWRGPSTCRGINNGRHRSITEQYAYFTGHLTTCSVIGPSMQRLKAKVIVMMRMRTKISHISHVPFWFNVSRAGLVLL